MILFKNSYRTFYKDSHRQVNVLPAHFANYSFGPSAYQTLLQIGGAWRTRVEIVWKNGYRLANRVTYVCGPANFNQSVSILNFDSEVRRHRAYLELWQCVTKGDRKVYPTESFGNVKAAERMSCGTSGNSTTIQEADFSNFDLTYLPCCLHSTRHY
jgi:hypothetical protein